MITRNGVAVAIVLTAAGCGGSGGGSDAPPLSPPGAFSITSDNGGDAAAVSYRSAQRSGEMAGLVGSTGLIGSSGGGSSWEPVAGSLSKPLRTAVSRIPFGPDTLPCQVSGTITISGDLADPMTLTADDWILIEASACDDGLGEIIDGTIEFTVDTFTGDIFAGVYLLTMDLDVTDFQVSTADDVYLSDGDVTATIDTRSVPVVAASVSGASMTTSSNASLDTLSDFASSQTLDAGLSPSPYTLEASGNLESSLLEGPVHYSTPVTFQGFDTDYPGSGELLATAPDDTSARLIAENNVEVTIELDTDGDGAVDETIESTWAELLN